MPGTEALYDDAPLNDRAYEPQTVPVNGRIPDVVGRWGPRSQLRWFHRFWDSIRWRGLRQAGEDPDGYYVHSVMHTGGCCAGCMSDEEYGYPNYDDRCCCKAPR
jgi:hypothetical protein